MGRLPKGLASTLAAAAALVSLIPASAGAHPAHPTDRDQPLRDGCQRANFLDIIQVNSPEWVYINRDPTTRVAIGTVRVPHPTPIDQPGTHDWYDVNANLVPDQPYRYVVAGSRSAHTNNYAGDDADAGESFARLHYEWEEGSFPKFAWPSDGDRVKLWGSWIWDCGHWTDGDEITGERSEFHPLSASVVTRRNSYRARRGEIETDAYISTDGTYAHATEECALRLQPQSNGTYGPGFYGCARHHANQRQKVERSYTFFVPAPRRPAGAGRLVLRTVSKSHSGRARERIRRRATGFQVTVFTSGRVFHYGKEFFARWAASAPTSERLRVTLQDLLVKQADPDASEGGADPDGEKWALYVEVNGFWKLVNDWAPSLYAAHDDMTVHLNRSITVNVPAGSGLRLFMMGRECDGPSGVVLLGHYVPRTKPCPYNRTESKISEHNNDDPGTVLDRYKSPAAAIGTHTAKSAPTVFFPGTGAITFNDGVQGDDDYELTYKVSRMR